MNSKDIFPTLNEVDPQNIQIARDTGFDVLPVSTLNHSIIKAAFAFMEKVNTLHRESLLSSTYSLNQSDSLLRHFVSQCRDAPEQQCKAAQVILGGWSRLLWNPGRDEPIERIAKIANYCIRFPHEQAPLIVILHRCLVDLVNNYDHPLQETLNQIKFIVAQQGLATQTPLFLEEQIEAVVKSDKKPWYANLFLPTLFCVSLTVVCQVWLYITWKILLI
ncbi:MAG: hypothetical protein CMF42_00670 [Legionellales bacterium]|nr:hypothetical protein [Legionellales bacterium]OUX68273.1 MAG: hypothetical protein CBD38_00215 [bacterium TMED178]